MIPLGRDVNGLVEVCRCIGLCRGGSIVNVGKNPTCGIYRTNGRIESGLTSWVLLLAAGRDAVDSGVCVC